MAWDVRRTGCARDGCSCGGYGYEISDASGVVVETGEIRIPGALFVAYPVGTAGPRGPRFPTSAEVLAWLTEHGPGADA